jgi:hypothetical protein
MANSKFNLSKGEEKKSSKFNLTKEEAPVTTVKGAQPTKKIKWWLWLLLLALVVIVVIFCVKNYSSNSDENTTIEPSGMTVEPPATVPAEETQNTGGEDVTDVTDEETTVSQPETTPVSPPPTASPVTDKAPVSGSIEEKAKRVIRGDFGNGAERINNLGSEYNAIQSKVNEMYRNGNTNY